MQGKPRGWRRGSITGEGERITLNWAEKGRWIYRGVVLGVKGLGRTIMRYLALHLGRDGRLDMARETIARGCDCSLGTVKYWITRLAGLGLITRQLRTDGATQLSNAYQLRFPPSADAAKAPDTDNAPPLVSPSLVPPAPAGDRISAADLPPIADRPQAFSHNCTSTFFEVGKKGFVAKNQPAAPPARAPAAPIGDLIAARRDAFTRKLTNRYRLRFPGLTFGRPEN